jgi:hypothetical protein
VACCGGCDESAGGGGGGGGDGGGVAVHSLRAMESDALMRGENALAHGRRLHVGVGDKRGVHMNHFLKHKACERFRIQLCISLLLACAVFQAPCLWQSLGCMAVYLQPPHLARRNAATLTLLR